MNQNSSLFPGGWLWSYVGGEKSYQIQITYTNRFWAYLVSFQIQIYIQSNPWSEIRFMDIKILENHFKM